MFGLLTRLNSLVLRRSPIKNILNRRLSLHKKLITEQKVFAAAKKTPSTRYLSSDTIDNDSTLKDIDDTDSVLKEIDEKSEEFRLTLYSNDVPDIERINKAATVDELLSILSDIEISKEVACQSLIVLYDILEPSLIIRLGPLPYLKRNFEVAESVPETILTKPEITNVLNKLHDSLEEESLSFDEMSCSLMYLNKMGIPIHDPLLQKIILAFQEKLQKSPESVTMTALSRFVVAVFGKFSLFSFYTCIDLIPHLFRQLQQCDNSKDIRLISICLNLLVRMVSNDFMEVYKSKVDELIKTGVLNGTTVKDNLKILYFLNSHYLDANNYTKLIRDLVLMVEPDIPTMTIKELLIVQKSVNNIYEPYHILSKLAKRSDKLLKTDPCSELMLFSMFDTTEEKRQKCETMAAEFIDQCITNFDPSFHDFFPTLQKCHTPKNGLNDRFWDKVMRDFEPELYKIPGQIYQYRHINNNDMYRNREFESRIMKLLFDEVQNGLTSIIPRSFARAIFFIVAYTNSLISEPHINDLIFEKMESMSQQFSINECLEMSKGLQRAHDMRYTYYIPAKEAPYLLKMVEILNGCAERHLQQLDLNVSQANSILKAFNARKCTRKSHLFQKIIDKLEETFDKGPINSQIMRFTFYQLYLSRYRSPKIFQKGVEYIVENKDYIGVALIDKVLWCLYFVGYVPNNEEFYEISNKIIQRDFNLISGLSIIQSCLALAFFKALDKELISLVFNINFIKRLESEVKTSYTHKMLHIMMLLNRAVCLDFPEANIPWFQQNYIEAQMSKAPNIKTKFALDVRQELHGLVKDKSWLKENVITPYGYKIDFVLYLNEKQEIIPPPTASSDAQILKRITKLAVIPLRHEAFCENPPYTHLKGIQLLKMHHLEVLGYKVIQINEAEWNSMYLNVPGARLEYLKDLIKAA